MEAWELAYRDKLAGMKRKEIAEKYGVSENTVKSWWARHGEKLKQKYAGAPKAKKRGAPSSRKKAAPKPPAVPGAPLGNKNAKGSTNNGGAPEGNTNNLQHGLYSSALTTSALSEAEVALVKGLSLDPEQLLEEQIKMLAVREMRILQIIKALSTSEKPLTPVQVLRMEQREELPRDFPPELMEELVDQFRTYQSGDYKGKYKRHSYHLHTTSVANIELIGKYEAELTRLQKAMIKAIVELNKIKESSGATGDKNLVEDWIAGVMAARGGDAGG